METDPAYGGKEKLGHFDYCEKMDTVFKYLVFRTLFH